MALKRQLKIPGGGHIHPDIIYPASASLTVTNNLKHTSLYWDSVDTTITSPSQWYGNPVTINYGTSQYPEGYNSSEPTLDFNLVYKLTGGGSNDWVKILVHVDGSDNTCTTSAGGSILTISGPSLDWESSGTTNPSCTVTVGETSGNNFAVRSWPIPIGQVCPNISVTVLENGREKAVNTHQLFTGTRVVLFSVQGAFLPGSKERFLSFEPLLQKNVGVFMTAVNDIFVLKAFEAQNKGSGKIVMLADGGGDFVNALGLLDSSKNHEYGKRAYCFAAVITNNMIEYLGVDIRPASTASTAETVVLFLQPKKH